MTDVLDPTVATPRGGTISAPRRVLGIARAEGKRLRRPTFAGVGLAVVALFATMGTFVVFAASETAGIPMGAVIGDVSGPEGIVAGLALAADLIGIVMLALWAAAVSSDYGSGWVRLMVQAEPRRWRIIAGKLLTLVGFTLVATLLATIVSVVVAPLAAATAGIDTAAWGTDPLAIVAEAWFNLTVVALVWGAIGFAVASITRSAIVAIAGGIGYLMVFEGMLTLVAEDLTTYLPGSILDAVSTGGNAALAYGTALGLAGAFAAVAVGLATWIFSRRDIVS
jgi:ABC-type transport system involved in multi-copper enzyme maturation permease subunit